MQLFSGEVQRRDILRRVRMIYNIPSNRIEHIIYCMPLCVGKIELFVHHIDKNK